MPRQDPPFRRASSESQDSDRSRSSISSSLRSFFSDDRRSESSVPETFLEQLEPVWDRKIVPLLIESFGRKAVLHTIFYDGDDEVIMEVWDPKYVRTIEAQVFKFRGISPKDARHFVAKRSQAKVLELRDWN
ncbi:MAG: hypothetical protein NT070_20945 [Cyanobacteria bacterium]|nr:hypothetical protein [Cyanobacteriota bacterium]